MSQGSPSVHHSPIASSKQVALAVLASKLSQENHVNALSVQDSFLFKKPRSRLFTIILVQFTSRQPAFTCSSSAIETPEQCMKSVQS